MPWDTFYNILLNYIINIFYHYDLAVLLHNSRCVEMYEFQKIHFK